MENTNKQKDTKKTQKKGSKAFRIAVLVITVLLLLNMAFLSPTKIIMVSFWCLDILIIVILVFGIREKLLLYINSKKLINNTNNDQILFSWSVNQNKRMIKYLLSLLSFFVFLFIMFFRVSFINPSITFTHEICTRGSCLPIGNAVQAPIITLFVLLFMAIIAVIIDLLAYKNVKRTIYYELTSQGIKIDQVFYPFTAFTIFDHVSEKTKEELITAWSREGIPSPPSSTFLVIYLRRENKQSVLKQFVDSWKDIGIFFETTEQYNTALNILKQYLPEKIR